MSPPVLAEEGQTNPQVRTAEIRKLRRTARATKWWVGGLLVPAVGVMSVGAKLILERMAQTEETTKNAALVIAEEAKAEVKIVKMELRGEIREVRDDVRETRTDIRDLYRAVQRGQRSKNLERDP
jgi:hypothetical protein